MDTALSFNLIQDILNNSTLFTHNQIRIENDYRRSKNIRLVDYLQSLGYTPVRQQGANLWYKSPFREETKASFKVNTEINKWYDFGLGQGGNIIALVSELYSSVHVPYLLQRIAEQTPHIRPVSFSFRKQSSTEPNFQRMEVRKLDFPVLLSYLQGRGINLELAKRECNEVHFENNGKRYFAIGFRNMAGGYEIRNRYFKGCIAPKDITHIRHEGRRNDTCFVFEGFIDYLSFLTIRTEKCSKMPCLDWQNYIILNSVSNLHKAIDGLAVYERIHCFSTMTVPERKLSKDLQMSIPTVSVTHRTLTRTVRT